jgi:hypothetical protein
LRTVLVDNASGADSHLRGPRPSLTALLGAVAITPEVGTGGANVSDQPGQGDGATGRGTAPATGKGSARPDGGADPAVWRALWLGGGALVVSPFFFPVGLVLGIAALVIGIKAARRPGRQGSQGPIVGGIVLGSLGLMVATAQLVLSAILWPETGRYQDCMGAANTTTDENVCKDRYFTEIERKLDLPPGAVSRYQNLF